VACQLLRDTPMSVGAIATSLHYGDSSAFAHAFRRWSGESPTRWRESAHRAQPESGNGARHRSVAAQIDR